MKIEIDVVGWKFNPLMGQVLVVEEMEGKSIILRRQKIDSAILYENQEEYNAMVRAKHKKQAE